MVEFDISVLLGVLCAVSSDLIQLHLAIGHLIHRHVGVSEHGFHLLAALVAHHSHRFHTFHGFSLFFSFSKVFHLLLLTLSLNEFLLEGVEQSLSVWGHFLDFTENGGVASSSCAYIGQLKVDTNEVKCRSRLLNELKEVLALGLLKGLGVLEDNKLELDDSLEFGKVCSTHIKIRLVHELLAVLP